MRWDIFPGANSLPSKPVTVRKAGRELVGIWRLLAKEISMKFPAMPESVKAWSWCFWSPQVSVMGMNNPELEGEAVRYFRYNPSIPDSIYICARSVFESADSRSSHTHYADLHQLCARLVFRQSVRRVRRRYRTAAQTRHATTELSPPGGVGPDPRELRRPEAPAPTNAFFPHK